METRTLAQRRRAGALDIASGLGSLASGYASLAASRIDAQQFKIQETFLNLQASAQKLKSRENAVFLREKFLKTVAGANVSFAKRGVSISSGIGRQFKVESLENLAEDIKANELNSQAIQNTLTLQAGQSNIAQRFAKNVGILSVAKFAEGVSGVTEGFGSLLGNRRTGAKVQERTTVSRRRTRGVEV